jgi:hypothetical protein
MKRISTLILAFAFIFNASASNADLFSYDLSEINTELSDLEVVENVITYNQNSTIEEINKKIINNNFLSNSFDTNYNSSLMSRNAFTLDDMDWGAYAWGLLCCPVGFFVVVTNKDKEKAQKTSFFAGWLTAVIINSITYVVAFAAA